MGGSILSPAFFLYSLRHTGFNEKFGSALGAVLLQDEDIIDQEPILRADSQPLS